MTAGVFSTGGGRFPYNSLDMLTGTKYLSMSNADFGAYNRNKFAIVGSAWIDSLASDHYLLSKGNASAKEFELRINNGGTITFTGYDGATTLTGQKTTTNSCVVNRWNSFMVQVDTSLAAADRIKIWLNSTQETLTGAVNLSSIGSTSQPIQTTRDTLSDASRAYLNSMAVFSTTLPSAGDVFAGNSGVIRDLRTVSGLYSLLDGVSATSDYVLSADWINTGSVTTIRRVPPA